MSILLSLSPFAVFFVLMRLHSPIAGLLGALVASLVLLARMRRRKEAVKILEVGTLALFGLLVAYTWIGAPTWTVATVRLAVDVGLLAIVLVSLAIGQPFTIQYARERVPEQFWALPVFFTTNLIISATWAGAFAVMVAADAAAEWVPAIPLWMDIGATLVALGGAIWFSNWYPAVVQRRRLAAAAS
jgi:hypothetical protein